MSNEKNALIIKVLEEGIALEQDGEKFYRDAASQTTDPFGKNLFNRLADDEKEHHSLLNSELGLVKKLESLQERSATSGEKEKKWIDELTANRLKIFPSTSDYKEKDTDKDNNNLSFLRAAIAKEDASISLYSRGAETVQEGEIKKFLDHLVCIEQQHKDILSDYLSFLEDPEAGWDTMERWACQS